MTILLVNGGNLVALKRPYLSKFNPDMTIENSIMVQETDDVHFIDNEMEAFQLLQQRQYDSLIISTGGEVDGFFLLDSIRQSETGTTMPITII